MGKQPQWHKVEDWSTRDRAKPSILKDWREKVCDAVHCVWDPMLGNMIGPASVVLALTIIAIVSMVA